MELINAVRLLSALAQPNRLEVYRLLVKAGKQGIAAGDIARALDVAPNTLSAQLNILSNSGLVTSVRKGRSIIYAADFKNMGDLLVYLVEDCCNGNPEICLPIAEATKCLDGCE